MYIAAMFKELLDIDAAGPDDDFFQLGGDSLLATSLMAGIERDFGVVLPVSLLIYAPTPRGLAACIVEAATDAGVKCMMTVSAEGNGPALFCIHGMNGDTVISKPLWSALGGERPLYAFRAVGLHSGEVPASSVPEIAANYIEEIRAVVPDGPYLLLGHCGGSLIAYEMAQQLRAAGKDVLGLVMIDPSLRDYIAWMTSSGMRMQIRIEQSKKDAQQAISEAIAKPKMGGGSRRDLVHRALSGVVGAYVPSPYPGETLLIYRPEAKERFLNPKFGFPRLLPKLESEQVENSDHFQLFRERLDDTARIISRFLDRVAPIGKGAA